MSQPHVPRPLLYQALKCMQQSNAPALRYPQTITKACPLSSRRHSKPTKTYYQPTSTPLYIASKQEEYNPSFTTEAELAQFYDDDKKAAYAAIDDTNAYTKGANPNNEHIYDDSDHIPDPEKYYDIQYQRDFQRESGWQRIWRKSKEAPLIPIGLAATTTCLAMGVRSMWHKDPKKSQFWMRGRVLAQGGTLVAMMTWITWKQQKRQREIAEAREQAQSEAAPAV